MDRDFNLDLPPVVRNFLEFYGTRGTTYGPMNRRYLKMLLSYVEAVDRVTALQDALERVKRG